MNIFLDVLGVWIALDVVLVATWHVAHVRSRRLGTRALAIAPTPASSAPAQAHVGDAHVGATHVGAALVAEPQPAMVLAASA